MTSAACELIANSGMRISKIARTFLSRVGSAGMLPTLSSILPDSFEDEMNTLRIAMPLEGCRQERAECPRFPTREHPCTAVHGVAVVAGAGAGEPKLNCTGGGLSAPVCAVKNGRGGKPSIPAIKFVGKLRTATL